MGLGTSLERTDRWAVDPNCTKPTRGEVAGCVRRNRYIVLKEQSGSTASRISGLKKQPLARADPMRPKFVEIDHALVAN